MSDVEKWRARADKMLSGPVKRVRSLTSTVGKVEDRFDAIYDARRRGMAWKEIAKALESGKPISVDAVQSALKRICAERGIAPPSARGSYKDRLPTNVPTTEPKPEADLFNAPFERWVDDGE